MNKKGIKKSYILLFDLVFAALLLAFDQFTKYLAVRDLKGKAAKVLIEGVLELQYLENRGSAFGMFQDRKIMLLTIGIIFMVLIFLLLLKIPSQRRYNVLHVLFTAIIAGGLGNMIDRFRLDYVVDFISVVLINYPIFNVADIYVVLASIGLFVMFVFIYSDEELGFLSFRNAGSHAKKNPDRK